MRCAVIGLGEAGLIYANALQGLGHEVIGYDAAGVKDTSVLVAGSVAEAVGHAEIILVMTPAAASIQIAKEAGAYLSPMSSYADFTSSSPAAKRALSLQLPAGIRTADVAILGPVISLGVMTPLMAAGSAAQVVADLLSPAGAPVEVVDGNLGDAMVHKLLRSIFTKGLAAVVGEAVEAGQRAGHEEWVLDQIAFSFSGDGRATIRRLITGSKKHATRRAEEMLAVVEYCEELGTPSVMSAAARESLIRLEETH